jgi:GNAT superfamily N-acetyltransferase
MTDATIKIRAATATDTDFILSLVPRLVAFPLPKGRRRDDCASAIHRDIAQALAKRPRGEAVFITEDDDGDACGFMRLQIQDDFFSGTRNCHVSDLVVAAGHDGHGIGHALLDHAHQWARRRRCQRLTLSVFPGNQRARALYEHTGFQPDMIRMMLPLA